MQLCLRYMRSKRLEQLALRGQQSERQLRRLLPAQLY
jgi:hypothetical protein